MFRTTRLLSTLTLTSALMLGACTTSTDDLAESAAAISAPPPGPTPVAPAPTVPITADNYSDEQAAFLAAAAAVSLGCSPTDTLCICERVSDGPLRSMCDLAIEPEPVIEAPAPATHPMTESEQIATWGLPTRGDEHMPCYPEGSCDDLTPVSAFADPVKPTPAPIADPPPINDAKCDKPAKTISADFYNKSSANHIANVRDHIYRLTGNLGASYTEGCTNDFIAGLECINRESHGSKHKVAVKAWCVKNEFWDPKDNPAKCLPKIDKLPAKEQKWGSAGVHKHSGDTARSTCAWLRGDPDMGAKFCSVAPRSTVDWKPEHVISLRVNGRPVDVVSSWNVGLGGGNAATHADGGVQLGGFMGYGPVGFFAHVAQAPANVWYTAKVENATIGCDDEGNVVETRERSKSFDPVDTE